MQLKAIYAALVLTISPAIAQTPPTDEQVEQAAVQNAMQVCGAAATYNIQALFVYCQVAKFGDPVVERLKSAIKAKSADPKLEPKK